MTDLFERYISIHATKRKKASSLRNDLRMIEKGLKPAFGRSRVEDVTRKQIRSYHARMKDKPYEANRQLSLLSKIFSFAADDLEWIDRSAHPVQGIKRFRETGRQRYLSDEEIFSLGVALEKAEAGQLARAISPYAVAMIRLLLLTGARQGEILSLRWDEVNFERGCLELSDSKTGRKEIYLSEPALDVLNGLPRKAGNPFVIVGAKTGSHLVNIKDPWGIIRREAHLEDVRLHDLRHSFASLGMRAGLSLPVIGKLLGHGSVQTTARYAHLADDPQKSAVASIGADIKNALGKSKHG